MAIRTKLLLGISIIFLLTFITIELVRYRSARVEVEQDLFRQAETIRNIMMSTRRVYHKQFLDSGIMLTDKTVGFLPAAAMEKISKEYFNWDQSGIHFNNVSDRPRNPGNQASPIELEAIDYFRKNPKEALLFKPFYQEGKPFYLYARPIWVEKYCLTCHGDPKDAPEAIRTIYQTAWNYKEGELRGVLSVKLPAEVMEERISANIINHTILQLIGFSALFILVILLLRRNVTVPLQMLTKAIQTFANGHFTHKIQGFKGEFEILGRAFNEMATKITEHQRVLQNLNTELELAKNKAEIANQAKSTFLANMSHELRTPLNGILGYTQILSRDKTITPKQQEGIDIIHRSGEYLLTLVTDILDLSKIEAGRVELYLTDFNFPEFIRNINELFQIRAQQKGINFIYEPLSRLPLGVRTDEKRLRQVLINLLSNAIKFTNQGGVNLKVDYHGERCRFQVEDTGIGIAVEDIEKIFQPFQQLNSFDYKVEGTGLGLPITKKLIELMGGKLYVESTLGQGSTFSVELNLPEVSDLIKTVIEQQPIIVGFEGRSRKLLVIDDRQTNRSVMVNLLVPLGFEIIEAENGKEGLEKACERQIDLVITDLVMPVMDGFETARQMRKIPKLRNIPIIAASASVFDYHQQESKDAGCDAFIPKPFRVEALFDLLQQYLDLTWIYAKEEQPPMTAMVKATENPLTEMDYLRVALPAEQVSLLLDLAMMGDIATILETLDELEKEGEEYLPFIDKVRQLAKNFDEEQICGIMQELTFRE